MNGIFSSWVKDHQQRKEKELEDFKELITRSKRRFKAERIRTYIDELERRSIAKNNLTDEIKEQINWARKKADWYDPFIEAEDELLREVERNQLKFK